jgi:hypothetical protein
MVNEVTISFLCDILLLFPNFDQSLSLEVFDSPAHTARHILGVFKASPPRGSLVVGKLRKCALAHRCTMLACAKLGPNEFKRDLSHEVCITFTDSMCF